MILKKKVLKFPKLKIFFKIIEILFTNKQSLSFYFNRKYSLKA